MNERKKNLERLLKIIQSIEPQKVYQTENNETVLEENWKISEKINKIIDHYSFTCRMKCKVDELSPYEYSKKHKVNIFEASKKVNVCTNFNITRVIFLFKHIFGNNTNFQQIKWLDPSAGWGSRLIGAIALDLAQYQGIDPNTCMTPVYKNIINELSLKPSKFNVWEGGFENFPLDKFNLNNNFDIVFTSPPFFDFEIYSKNTHQSTEQYPNVQSWTTGFLIPLVDKSFKALKKNGFLVLYIESKKADYVQFIQKYIQQKYNINHNTLFMKYDDNQILRSFYIWKKTF